MTGGTTVSCFSEIYEKFTSKTQHHNGLNPETLLKLTHAKVRLLMDESYKMSLR